MLYLKPVSHKILDNYFLKVKDKIITNINDSQKGKFLTTEAKVFLLTELENIIKADPVELKELNEIFFKKLNIGLKYKYYSSYLHFIKTDPKKIDPINKFIRFLYKKQLKNIEKIFDYNLIISGNQSKSYWLAKQINTNTCAYCNRLYANVIEIGDGNNNNERIARPFFDHWYAKSKFPMLALSFYNLIPSCSVCNSSIKGSLDFDIDTHIHPYKKEVQNDFKFSYKHESLTNHNVIIRDFKLLSDKAKKTIEDFKIQHVYNVHSDKELKDLLDLRYKYSDNYIVELFQNTFDNLTITEDEVYRLVFGVETKEEDYHKRPFSKFKHDIIEELKKK